MAFQEFTGVEYLQMDIAGSFGLDNKDWDVRLAWFQQHQHDLLGMMKLAKEPALYFAGVQAWEDHLAGRPSGYPVSLDATCSGMQILTVLTGDRLAAALCNVIDVGFRADAYTSLYQSMLALVGQTGLITRDKTKQAILTSLYGSQAIPKQVFGEGVLLNAFHTTMEKETPAVWELNKTYLAIWDATKTKYSWVLPDNGHVHVLVMGQTTESVTFLGGVYDVHTMVNMPVEEGRSLGANTTHSIDGMIVREMTRRCNYDPRVVKRVREALIADRTKEENWDLSSPEMDMVQVLWKHYKESGYLSARILDYINEGTVWLVDADVIMELIDSLPAKPFEIICIHDCFRCLPTYGNDLRRQYNRQLYEIARSDLLSSIFSQLLGHPAKIGKMDPTLADEILESNYAIC